VPKASRKGVYLYGSSDRANQEGSWTIESGCPFFTSFGCHYDFLGVLDMSDGSRILATPGKTLLAIALAL
jgi:hypothetical protein